MKIVREARYIWNGTEYVKIYEDSYEYVGPVELLCGPSADQTSVMNTQLALTQQAQQQSQAIFGESSTVFGDLMKSFAPIVAAGPNQQGFSAQENANLNSQAVTQGGVAYRNAKTAVGNAQAATGGGNVVLPSGAQIGTDASLAASAAENTANQESQITEQNYATGRQNYEQAAADLEGAPSVFGTSTNAIGTAGNISGQAANTANTINQQDTAWQTAAIGALGSLGGAALGGLTRAPMFAGQIGPGGGGGGGGGGSSAGGGDISPDASDA
jgi:hypothetical protein